MKLHWVPCNRLPRWPLWGLLLGGGMLALVALVHFGIPETLRPGPLCLFKRLTSLPCPSCGSTRIIDAALHGRMLDAWFNNPLVASILLIVAALLVWRVAFGRALGCAFSPGQRRAAWVMAVVLLAVNWIYLIANGR